MKLASACHARGARFQRSTLRWNRVVFARHWYSIVLSLSLLAVTAGGGALAQPMADCGDRATQGFAERFVTTYKEHLAWDGPDPNAPPAKFRGVPAVIDSPPFPFTNWPPGGSENIGYENATWGALMDTIYCGENGQAWKDTRVTLYGWLEPGGNLSTSHTRFNFVNGTGGNYASAYGYQPNAVQLDQLALYCERTPDSVQTDHLDWGFRVTGPWGPDYEYTFAHLVDPASRQYERHEDLRSELEREFKERTTSAVQSASRQRIYSKRGT